MKKLIIIVVAGISLLFASCAEKTTDVTVAAAFQELMVGYNLETVAEKTTKNEDGSITYTIVDSSLSSLREDLEKKLENSIERFASEIKEQNAEIVIDVAFSENATVLEGTVTDAFGSKTGMIFLTVSSYPDILLTQILAGIEPTGITLKLTDAVTGEKIEENLPF